MHAEWQRGDFWGRDADVDVGGLRNYYFLIHETANLPGKMVGGGGGGNAG